MYFYKKYASVNKVYISFTLYTFLSLDPYYIISIYLGLRQFRSWPNLWLYPDFQQINVAKLLYNVYLFNVEHNILLQKYKRINYPCEKASFLRNNKHDFFKNQSVHNDLHDLQGFCSFYVSIRNQIYAPLQDFYSIGLY